MRKIVISLFFVALIVSPIAGFILKKGAFFQEGPFLAPLPAFTRGALLNDHFYKGLESYLDVRNPFRAQFIRTKSWSDVRIFKTSSTDNIHMGRNKWLYYRPAIKSYLKADCKNKKKAYKLARTLRRLERRLKKEGKRFVFLVGPDKATIYPEYVGGVREANGCGQNFYDLFLEALKTYPLKGFVRLDKRFLEEKKTNLLYYSGGTHWNDRGAALASRLVLEKLSTPELSYHLPEIYFREKRIMSELSQMLSVGVYESATLADTILYKTDVETENIEEEPTYQDEWVKLRTRAHGPAGSPLLPKTIMYRDSFMTTPLEFIKGSFEEIYARWSYVFPEATETSSRELATSDIVIIEVVERNLAMLQIRPALAIKEIKQMKASVKKPAANNGAIKVQ